jgi:hypothetical protein
MKIVEELNIVAGGFERTATWRRACEDIEEAISRAGWPPGTDGFALNPLPQGGNRHPNGVKPIKIPMIQHLASRGWETESLPELPVGSEGRDVLTTGDLDALLLDGGAYVGFEWETGNVSSSHRAINKLLDGIGRGTLAGGVLALPMRETARYLTDRVGNFEEISPYFEYWSKYPAQAGVLRIYGVSYDVLDDEVPYIPKGRDGRALG